MFERLLALRNDLALLAEEYDPVQQRRLGNFPQAFSHMGLIQSALLRRNPDPAGTLGHPPPDEGFDSSNSPPRKPEHIRASTRPGALHSHEPPSRVVEFGSKWSCQEDSKSCYVSCLRRFTRGRHRP
ncbi:hypothetical protein SRO_0152 [Streptomyces rochei]|nr:hypothetical protein SRO_0152 [Streptomyces rochei]